MPPFHSSNLRAPAKCRPRAPRRCARPRAFVRGARCFARPGAQDASAGAAQPPQLVLTAFHPSSLYRRYRTQLVVLGDRGVGKSVVIRVLREYAGKTPLDVCEGLPETEETLAQAVHSCAPLIVWNAADSSQSLVEYVSDHIQQLTKVLCAHAMANRNKSARGGGATGGGAGGASGETAAAMESRLVKMLTARKLVLCNKTDIQPCPLPEIAALDSSTYFLAGSALRGTNMRELWRRVETCAAPRPPPDRHRAATRGRSEVRYSKQNSVPRLPVAVSHGIRSVR